MKKRKKNSVKIIDKKLWQQWLLQVRNMKDDKMSEGNLIETEYLHSFKMSPHIFLIIGLENNFTVENLGEYPLKQRIELSSLMTIWHHVLPIVTHWDGINSTFVVSLKYNEKHQANLTWDPSHKISSLYSLKYHWHERQRRGEKQSSLKEMNRHDK